jgi:hypothetical protein
VAQDVLFLCSYRDEPGVLRCVSFRYRHLKHPLDVKSIFKGYMLLNMVVIYITKYGNNLLASFNGVLILPCHVDSYAASHVNHLDYTRLMKMVS